MTIKEIENKNLKTDRIFVKVNLKDNDVQLYNYELSTILNFLTKYKILGFLDYPSIYKLNKDITDYNKVLINYSDFYYKVRNSGMTCNLLDLKIYSKIEDLEIIEDEEEIKSYIENEQYVIDEIKKEKDDLFNNCLISSKESYINRLFISKEEEKLYTNYNIVLGKYGGGAFTYKYRECCSFTKNKELDFEIYIPTSWLNYFGYTIYDLVEYLKFLKNLDINFNYEYLGNKEIKIEPRESTFIKTNSIILKQNTFIPKKNKSSDFVSVLLKNTGTTHNTYLNFLLIRYIWNHQYWTIPGHALQIKRSLGKLVSYSEALLLAHLYKTYNGYYSLNYQTFTKDNSRHIDPFQKIDKHFISECNRTMIVNNCVAMLVNKYDSEIINKFFNNKDWFSLYWYCKNNK